MLHKANNFLKESDEALMLHIVNGEVKAFDELYNRYGKRLMSYFLKMLNFERELAEDALQDVFMKIAESPEKFDGSRPFKTWIFSVASNYCKNVYRHNEVVNRYHQEMALTSVTGHDLAERITKFDNSNFTNCLNNFLNQLAPEKKETFILRFQEEKSIAEIAQIQGCPEGSVKSRLHYTIKHLEEKLQQFNPVK